MKILIFKMYFFCQIAESLYARLLTMNRDNAIQPMELKSIALKALLNIIANMRPSKQLKNMILHLWMNVKSERQRSSPSISSISEYRRLVEMKLACSTTLDLYCMPVLKLELLIFNNWFLCFLPIISIFYCRIRSSCASSMRLLLLTPLDKIEEDLTP